MHEHYTPTEIAAVLAFGLNRAAVEKATSGCPDCARAAETLRTWQWEIFHPDPAVACEQALGHLQYEKLRSDN